MAHPRQRIDETVSRYEEKGVLTKEDWQDYKRLSPDLGIYIYI
jgi:hypothetical protein